MVYTGNVSKSRAETRRNKCLALDQALFLALDLTFLSLVMEDGTKNRVLLISSCFQAA